MPKDDPVYPQQLSPWELQPGDIVAGGMLVESVVPDPVNEGLFAIKFAGDSKIGLYANEKFVVTGRAIVWRLYGEKRGR